MKMFIELELQVVIKRDSLPTYYSVMGDNIKLILLPVLIQTKSLAGKSMRMLLKLQITMKFSLQ